MIDRITSGIMAGLPWLEHGFGTRTSLPPSGIVTLKQIHSDMILVADYPGPLGEADGVITNTSGVAISVRTADCYPILLADTRNRAVAAIHAGWRGTAAEIALRALEKMKIVFGTDPADVHAAIGPGIGLCCYEVGEEVARQFKFGNGKHIDLASENRTQLEQAGLLPENIEALGVCTFCDTERFFSYRREKEKAGRMTSFIRIVAGN